jgi:hypothetical protein
MPIDSIRIGHVLQHDLAHLQRSFSKLEFRLSFSDSEARASVHYPMIRQQKDEDDRLPPSQPSQNSHL